MHVRMMHVCMMRQILSRTDQRTNKAILGVGWTNVDLDVYIHDACIHDTYIHAPLSSNDVCMFDAYILDPDTRGHDAHIYDA